MEEILLKLLVADNTTIQQGTDELREAFKKPESTPALYQLIISSPNSMIRQYSAVLLRKRYSKGKYWQKLPQQIRNEFKSVILQALVNEPEKLVKNAIAQLIGVLIKHELPSNGWPEVLQFVQQLTTSENLADKELGIYTLSIITEIAPEAYRAHASALAGLLAQTLNSLQDVGSPVAYYVIRTMQNLIPLVKDNQMMVNAYHQMMPRTMATIQFFTKADEEKAIQCFELLDELCESAITVLAPHIKPLVGMCLAIATDKSLDNAVRVKAVTFIGWLAKTKKKAMIKHKLVEPILEMLFTLMSTQPEDDNDEVYFNSETEDSTPVTCATQTLDFLALNLPPEKLIQQLLRYIEPSLQGTDIYAKKASFLAMAVLAEGCSEYIRTKYLESFLRCTCQGITDPNPVVRNAAFFALGQFSEHLQPDVSTYSKELLPILFDYLGQICTHLKQEKKEPTGLADRMFYALEMFCENLNESLLPYLPIFMERLFEILSTDTPVHIKELSLSAIGSAALASKENMLPYFERIVTILNGYLSEKQTDETMCLQVQAVDTLGVIARTIGDNNFAPLAGRSLEFGMKLLKETEDPDFKKSIYGLFASISMVMKKQMAFALPEIIEYLISSIQSSEGIVPHFKDDESSAFPVYEDISEDENEEEDIENTDNEDDNDDEDVAGYSVENAYIEEKEEAILALKEIADNTEEAFLPYLEKSFEETFKVINYPQEDICKAAIDALLQFCINFSKINTNEGKQALWKALAVFIPKLSELIRLGPERTVAISGFDAYTELLKEVKSDVLVGEGHKEAIINCVTEVLSGSTACQDPEDAEDAEDTDAEQDELLAECAGDVLAAIGKLIPPEDFEHHFQNVLPKFLERLKRNKSEAQRSFAVGTISECFAGLQYRVINFLPQLLPMFLKLTEDPSAEVRNNAIYGIGELVLHGKEAVYPHYNDILNVLSSLICKESHVGARDNIVGAISRLIITNYAGIPLDQVFPIFVKELPLKEDFEENKALFKSILTLYQAGHTVLQSHMNTLLKVAVSVLHENKTTDDEAKNFVMEFVKSAQRDFPNEWNSVYSELPAEVATNIQRIFS